MATQESKLIVSLIDRVTAPSRAIAAGLKGLNSAIERNNSRLAATRGQMLDAVGAAYALARGLGSPIQAAIDLESQMADIAKVTDFDDAGLKKFERSLRDLAVNEIPLAVSELTALAAAAAQSGVPEDDLYEFTRMVAKSAVAWEVSGGEAGEALAKIRTALKLTNEQTGLYADAINYLSDQTAASAPDLVDFAKRVASQGEFFGFSREQSLAFGSAMVSAGAEVEVAATSFRNMGRALTRGASATRAQRGAYKALGLDARNVAKRMQKDAVGTTTEVIRRLGKLPEHMQAAVMSDLFGDEARALAPLLNNIDLLLQHLGYVSDKTQYAGKVNEEFARRSQTTAYEVQRFKNNISELGITVGSALLPPLNELMSSLLPIIKSMAKFAEENPGLTRAIVGTTAAIVGLNVALIAIKFASLFAFGGILKLAKGGLLAAAGIAKLGGMLGRLVGIGRTAGTTLPAAMEGFSRLSQKAAGNANAATAASRRMVEGMGAARRASDKMVSGMSSAAASASTAGFATYGERAGKAATVGFNKALAIGGALSLLMMAAEDLSKTDDERLKELQTPKAAETLGYYAGLKKKWKSWLGFGDDETPEGASSAPGLPEVGPFPESNPFRQPPLLKIPRPLPRPTLPTDRVESIPMPDLSGGARAVEQAGTAAGTDIGKGGTDAAAAISAAAQDLRQAGKDAAAAISSARPQAARLGGMRPPVNADFGNLMPNSGVAGSGGN